MLIIMKRYLILVFALLLISCNNSRKKDVITLLQHWDGREVRFPNHSIFTIQGRDTVDFSIENKCKILTYIDSTGCTSCKLRFPDWMEFMHAVDSLRPDSVQFLFFFFPKKGTEIYQSLLADRFIYPICIDEEDSLNKLNNFPSNMAFQTFLLDKDNKVLAIGNPIYTSKIKELYINILSGKETSSHKDAEILKTKIYIDDTSLSLGNFNWENEQNAVLKLKNVGDNPLVIDAVSTSCGCAKVKFDRKPIAPGGSASIDVIYRAEHSGYFDKSITVHCNVKSSPIMLRITGNAE